MAQPKILVIDDDKNISRLVEFGLRGAEMDPIIAHDGQEGLRALYAHQPDLVILDIMMPKMDGWTVCQRIREVSVVPVIMVTARSADADIVKGLDLGADDFVVKPVRMPVLLARVRACLRRAQAAESNDEDVEVTYSDDRLNIELQTRSISVAGEPVKLTPTEYNLLARLVRSAGRTLTYKQLLEDVWGWEYTDDIDYLRVYIWHLRQKLELDSRNPIYILTEHGVGYRFAKLAQ
jgi:two-component system, OmpR family, KDP operon response regulator KdpE